jgi:hypothetical protein
MITRDSLMTLEAYARARDEFRARVMSHKKNRRVYLGQNVTLIFEDELTIRYQIQEMLRAEKIFDEEGIQDELKAYVPLVPDGSNWKATMMIEYPEPEERAARLGELIGIEDRVWVRVNGLEPVYAIADEDLERETEEKNVLGAFFAFRARCRNDSLTAPGGSLEHGSSSSRLSSASRPCAPGRA